MLTMVACKPTQPRAVHSETWMLRPTPPGNRRRASPRGPAATSRPTRLGNPPIELEPVNGCDLADVVGRQTLTAIR
jgi:hypothetical protein